MAFAAPGRNAGALLLEPVSVPRQQRDLAGIAELVDRVGGVAFVFDGQVHGPVSLLPAALRHEGGSPPGRGVQENVTTSRWTPLFDHIQKVRVPQNQGHAPNLCLGEGDQQDHGRGRSDGARAETTALQLLRGRDHARARQPRQPRLPLPVARMAGSHGTVRSDAVDEREGLFVGQRRRGGVLRAHEDGIRLSRAWGGVYPGRGACPDR